LIKIPPLPGDAYSFGNGINDEGDVVGISFGAGFATARAFIYHNGKAVDLNSLVGSNAPFLLAANAIDDLGTIVGQASDSKTNTAPAYIAHINIGCNRDAAIAAATKPQTARKPLSLPMQLRVQLLRKYGLNRP
jgi:probable HAF family extracellular repeat protein